MANFLRQGQSLEKDYKDWTAKKESNTFGAGAYLTGAGLGAGTFAATFPWNYRNVDEEKYPRLARLREAGKKGFKIISPSLNRNPEDLTAKEKIIKNVLWDELDPSNIRELKDFSGVAYIQSGEYPSELKPLSPRFANWGNWDVGVDKIDTWDYLKQQKASDLHVETLPAASFYQDRKLSEQGRKFIDDSGGLENIVVKHRNAARGKGVWMNAAELPEDVATSMFKNPKDYLLQKKMDLAEEFRVVTVGDKPVHTTYRFGSEKVRGLADKLGFKSMKDQADKAAFTKSPFEVIQPVFDRDLKTRLEDFATKASKELPYEIGALDIGLTKAGDFKIIEAQRQFGNISNPLVSRRVRNVVRGKPSKSNYLLAGLAAGAGFLGYHALSDEPSEPLQQKQKHNEIEGLHPKSEGLGTQILREYSDFGSGYIPFKGALFGETFSAARTYRDPLMREGTKIYQASEWERKRSSRESLSAIMRSKEERINDTTVMKARERKRIVKRNQRFREDSRKAVGVGMRAFNYATTGHTGFASTG